MTALPTATLQRPLLGILFMMLATSLFPVMNGLVKILSADYATEQIVWARTASHLVFVLLLFGPGVGLRIFRSVRLKAQIGRSLVLLASTACFFSGVKFLPLAEAASISFASPFIVALLAVPMLGERLSLVRLAAVAVGFLGVLVVIRPGSAVLAGPRCSSAAAPSSTASIRFSRASWPAMTGRRLPSSTRLWSAPSS